jgi:hypothetical protein
VSAASLSASSNYYPSSESRAIDQLSIVSDGQRSVRSVHHKRLAVDLFGGGAGRVARVAYAEIACENALSARRRSVPTTTTQTFQLFHGVVVEHIVDQAHALVHEKFALFIALGGDDSGALLTSANNFSSQISVTRGTNRRKFPSHAWNSGH